MKWGHETRVGYFAQDHHEAPRRSEGDAARRHLGRGPDEAETAFVRGALGRVLFSGDDVKKHVGALSGGEAARLVFCRIMVEKPNVLVLDEPTNHLDLESIEALVEALKAFEGTLLFVSHDRAFVSALATRILEVTPRRLPRLPRHVRRVPRALRRRSPRRRRRGPEGEEGPPPLDATVSVKTTSVTG